MEQHGYPAVDNKNYFHETVRTIFIKHQGAEIIIYRLVVYEMRHVPTFDPICNEIPKL